MVRILTAGESHGTVLVGILEGMPAGVPVNIEYINNQLRRRQQGYGRGGRMHIEHDRVEVLSGIRFGRTVGTPIALMLRNLDSPKWRDILSVEDDGSTVEKITIPRPGHADYAGSLKYRFDDVRNVIERASARETAVRVACCTVARKFLEELGIFIGSHVLRIGKAVVADRRSIDRLIRKHVSAASCAAYKVTEVADMSEVRMLDKTAQARAIQAIRKAKKEGDTLGGIFEVIVTGVPVGLGSHVQADRRLDGRLAQVLMSIPAVKGVEIGDGFESAGKPGSQVHDAFVVRAGRIGRSTNRAGGLEGGITNGQTIVLRGAMKPISTLAHPLASVDLSTGKPVRARYERSDVCAVPACSVIAEAVIAPVLADAVLEKFGGDSMEEVLEHYGRRSGKLPES